MAAVCGRFGREWNHQGRIANEKGRVMAMELGQAKDTKRYEG